MIKEITNFVDYLEDRSPEVFSENLKLKEGLYIFLEKEGADLVVKTENIVMVDDKTEKDNLYDLFLERSTNTEMLNAMKSFNSGPKVFIVIGTPFGIAFNGKAYKTNSEKKLLDSADAYFKAAQKFMDPKNEQHATWMNEFRQFVNNKLFDYLSGFEEYKKEKDQFMFYFFHKEPLINDYIEIQAKFLSEKLFNKDKFNVKNKEGEIFGISDNLSGFNDSKAFLKHQTSTVELNYRINGKDANKLYQFFRLQQKNKILPNPMPIFVDEKELTLETVKFYKSDTKKGHKEIIEHLLNDRKKDLQNYYLIYFQNGQKGSRIVDLDFVPVFRYNTGDMPKITALFKFNSKDKGSILKDFYIENIFSFESLLNDKLFLQYPKNSNYGFGILRSNYFNDKIEAYKGYTMSDTVTNLLYKYRKSLYDYIYKSHREAITFKMFYDMMINSVLDDIRHDKDHNKTFIIKEKLNIWFSLYNYFVNSDKNNDMVNKTEMLFEKINQLAKNEKAQMQSDDEFAFASGQLIRMILNKSETTERTHALLEPFLQKTDPRLFKLAIARAFETYKHAFQFYKGNNRYEFDKIISQVMGFGPTEQNMKNHLPLILAGYFAETIFKKELTQEAE